MANLQKVKPGDPPEIRAAVRAENIREEGDFPQLRI